MIFFRLGRLKKKHYLSLSNIECLFSRGLVMNLQCRQFQDYLPPVSRSGWEASSHQEAGRARSNRWRLWQQVVSTHVQRVYHGWVLYYCLLPRFSTRSCSDDVFSIVAYKCVSYLEGTLTKYVGKRVTERHVFLFDNVIILTKTTKRTTSVLNPGIPEYKLKETFLVRRINTADKEDSDGKPSLLSVT